MLVGVFSSQDEASRYAADLIRTTLAEADHPVLGVATGSTPLGIYKELRDAHAAGDFSLEGVPAVALDEYVGIAADHPERYRNVLRTELVGEDKTGLTDEDLITPDALSDDPRDAARRHDEAIAATGGVSIQILGIGSDGHIAFNEPTGSLSSRTHVETLTRQTREDNARFFDGNLDAVPTLAITQGLGTIMEAERVVLLAFGENKADAIHELVEGPVSAAWPATVLQHHNDAVILVDEAAASRLEHAEFYRERFEALSRLK